MPNFTVILAAAGKSSRFRDEHYRKPFAILKQKAVWLHSAEKFLKRSDVKQLIMVIAKADQDTFMSKFGANLAVWGIDVVIGGRERCHSIANALEHVDDSAEFVAIHDAARPCIQDDDIESVFNAAIQTKAAILASPVTSTLKRSSDGKKIDETVDRSSLWQALTPQVFDRQMLVSAYRQIGDFNPTDDAQLMERQGQPVTMVHGSPLNIKITTKRDLALAAACLQAVPAPRFDAPIHPFADDNLWR